MIAADASGPELGCGGPGTVGEEGVESGRRMLGGDKFLGCSLSAAGLCVDSSKESKRRWIKLSIHQPEPHTMVSLSSPRLAYSLSTDHNDIQPLGDPPLSSTFPKPLSAPLRNNRISSPSSFGDPKILRTAPRRPGRCTGFSIPFIWSSTRHDLPWREGFVKLGPSPN